MVEEPLGHPDGSERDTGGGRDPSVTYLAHLETASSEIDDDPIDGVETLQRGDRAQAGLLRAAEDADVDSLPHERLQEGGLWARGPDGCGRDCEHL